MLYSLNVVAFLFSRKKTICNFFDNQNHRENQKQQQKQSARVVTTPCVYNNNNLNYNIAKYTTQNAHAT